MKKPNPFAKGLALLFLVLLLASLAGRFWASEKAYGFSGPTHIAAGAGQVFLFAAGDIYRLSDTGELLSVVSPRQSGLADDPIDLQVTADGRLLIAEQRPAAIRLCDVESWACQETGFAASEIIDRQFKVLPTQAAGELLLTDAQGDTLWKVGPAGREPRRLVPDGTLAGPNDLAFDANGNLWVADTDHRKIVELLPSGDEYFQPGRVHSAVNELTIGERFFPMMLALTNDGRWWVTQAAEFSQPHSDLVIYDPEQGAQAIVELPRDAYATDIVALDDFVLVTDLERFVVYQVDSKTLAVAEFGDERFRAQLSRISKQRNYYDKLGYWLLAALILCAGLMLLAAVAATPKSRRWTRPALLFDPATAAAEVPQLSGIHWLERDPKLERSLKWLEHLGFMLFVAMAAGGLALYVFVRIQAGADAGPELESKINELGLILLLGGIAMALLIPLVRLSMRNLKRKLGTDGKNVFIRFEDGRELVAAPSDLAYTDKLIVYRHHIVPLMGGKQQPIYAADEVQTWLAPLLRQARRLTQMEAIRLVLKLRV